MDRKEPPTTPIPTLDSDRRSSLWSGGMTDLSEVRALAQQLTLTEATVGTPEVVESLANLKRATLAASTNDSQVDEWLSKEHMAGGVYATAATMNKRAEQNGSGDRFDLLSRSTLIARYNAWAQQFTQRIDAYQAGRGDVPGYLARLVAFHADPVHNEP